jgi:nicotinamide-nucleotide amidase
MRPGIEAPDADAVAPLAALLLAQGWLLATAESCTGGLIAAACTARAGSSLWFERGFVTYANAAKTESLGVPEALLLLHGAVSEAVARAMVLGALAHSHAQVALAVTGVAGPGGGSPDKPVGTVCFGYALPGRVWTERQQWAGDRAQVRAAAVTHALQQLQTALQAATGRPQPSSAP